MWKSRTWSDFYLVREIVNSISLFEWTETEKEVNTVTDENGTNTEMKATTTETDEV